MRKKTTTRQSRVADSVKHVVSKAIIQDVRDPRVEHITVTDVEVTPDLKIARIYITSHDSTKIDSALKGLSSAQPLLRRKIASELNLKYTPALKFFYDESLEQAERIESLLAKIKENK